MAQAPTNRSLDRAASLNAIESRRVLWDMVVIGGGATGVGIALDAASRGYAVALFEAADFGKGTSSRSTKLIHGGVRYLAQGDVPLVREALHERGVLLRNAPHIVHRLGFVIPAHSLLEAAWYRMGIGVYDTLSGSQRFPGSRWLSAAEAAKAVPGLRRSGLAGGVLFYDGQFDDARLLITLARTAASYGATLVNYAPVEQLIVDSGGTVRGVIAVDYETGRSYEAQARVVVNATGAFTDSVRRMARPASPRKVTASRGTHIVLDRSFLPSANGLLVPKTKDGRVLFAIPWYGHTLVGTTDIAIPDTPAEPVPSHEEIDFILDTAAGYLIRTPARRDILSTFAGIRPLVKADKGSTAELSRDHSIYADIPGLITIVGGKWTTYRRMAEDCVDLAARNAQLPQTPCRTTHVPLVGAAAAASGSDGLTVYGSEAMTLSQMMKDEPPTAARLHPAFPYTIAHVIWAVQHEMARTVEDLLARRTRMLFLNARAAVEAAPGVAATLAATLGRPQPWIDDQTRSFNNLASGYIV